MISQRGFTVTELMIGVALVAVVLGLAGPSFRDYIVMQRLKGTNQQLMSDMQFARSEAVSRRVNVYTYFKYGSGGMSCYTIFTDSTANNQACDCTRPPGSRCADTAKEIRTVQIPSDSGVQLSTPSGQGQSFEFDAITGGIPSFQNDFGEVVGHSFTVDTVVDSGRKLSTTIATSGRPQTCVPAGARVTGYSPCP